MLCGTTYGQRSPERVNQRNDYRRRRWGTRVGSISKSQVSELAKALHLSLAGRHEPALP